MRPRLDWDALSTFRAVLREASLSGGARALGIAQPTARRHVEKLENALGTALFVRSGAGLRPTKAALRILPYVEHIAAQAEALARSAADENDGGTVRITASEVVAVAVLPPLLAGLLVDHPTIEIQLTASNRQDDLLRHEADIAVRMTRPRQGSLIARRVGTAILGLFAHAAYLEAHGTPDQPHALRSGHRLIGEDKGHSIRSALGATLPAIADIPFGFRTDADLAQMAAIRAGIGIGIMQTAIARQDIQLRRVLPELSFPLEVWLVTHADLREETRIRNVFDSLAVSLARTYANA